MGLCYWAYCDDCKVVLDLDKFYTMSAYDDRREVADIEKENLREFMTESWVYRSLRLQWFIGKHGGHRQGVVNEYDERREDYTEVGMWPRSGAETSDEVDWTDPKAGRLVIRTKYGRIYLDYLPQPAFDTASPTPARVNCFRFTKLGRQDVVLLTEEDAKAEVDQ